MRLKGFRFFTTIAAPFIIAGIMLFSCSGKKKHSDILSPKQMVEALTNVYLGEQKVARLGLTTDSSIKVFDRIEKSLLQQSGTSDSVFRKSFDYYVDRPKELEQIYTAVIDTLSLREQRMEATSYPKK
jgi:hypothetical protein